MRQARIKVDAAVGEAVYHCMSRTVNGERLFDDLAKEVLRKQLWLVAEFCGLEIVTYAIMSNHFHVLVRVPKAVNITDEELLRRFVVLHPKPTKYQSARLEVIKSQLASDGPEAVAWRGRQLALMGDVSGFMRLLKQRFSVWFNKTHDRFGTLWSERFKSVLVEPQGSALRTMAAYIDLNAVRAGLVMDPKDYRFCGYSEAVAGNVRAQQGIASVGNFKIWSKAQSAYRLILFGTGSSQREAAKTISPDQFQQVLEQKGQPPLATMLRMRIRYFSDGAVLGSHAFVALHLRRGGHRRTREAKPMPPVANWGDLATLRGLRKQAFG